MDRRRVGETATLHPGLGAVDRVDVNQRRVALAAARLARRARDLVTALHLTTADLGRGDVDVVGVGAEARETDEAVTARGDVEDPGYGLARIVLALVPTIVPVVGAVLAVITAAARFAVAATSAAAAALAATTAAARASATASAAVAGAVRLTSFAL